MLLFRSGYFFLTLLLLSIEMLIALFVHDHFIRPYVGDFLVVILLYCFVRAFFNLSVITTAISALLFSYLVETLQYFKIVDKLNLQHSKLARVIIGTSFAWEDIICYTLGIFSVLWIEKLYQKKSNSRKDDH